MQAPAVLFVIVQKGSYALGLEQGLPQGARYTRDGVRALLLLVGCKPVHAHKVVKRLFRTLSASVPALSKAPQRREDPALASWAAWPTGQGSDVCVSLPRPAFFELLCTCLAEYKYRMTPASEELKAACSLVERRRCMVVLLCGTSGSGKSTLASILASRLGISTVLSTDSVRHMLRTFYSEQQAPALWVSTYQAGEALLAASAATTPHPHPPSTGPPLADQQPAGPGTQQPERQPCGQQHTAQQAAVVPAEEVAGASGEEAEAGTSGVGAAGAGVGAVAAGAGPGSAAGLRAAGCGAGGVEREACLQGYKAQCEPVMAQLDALITVHEARRESLIIEGVHLHTGLVLKLMQRHPSLVPFCLFIKSPAKHCERMAVRAKYMTLDPGKNRYVAHMQNIRWIQDLLVAKAEQHCLPLVENSNVDHSVACIHLTLTSVMRRLHKGEVLLDLPSRTTPSLLADFTTATEALAASSQGVREAVRCARVGGQGRSASSPLLRGHSRSVTSLPTAPALPLPPPLPFPPLPPTTAPTCTSTSPASLLVRAAAPHPTSQPTAMAPPAAGQAMDTHAAASADPCKGGGMRPGNLLPPRHPGAAPTPQGGAGTRGGAPPHPPLPPPLPPYPTTSPLTIQPAAGAAGGWHRWQLPGCPPPAADPGPLPSPPPATSPIPRGSPPPPPSPPHLALPSPHLRDCPQGGQQVQPASPPPPSPGSTGPDAWDTGGRLGRAPPAQPVQSAAATPPLALDPTPSMQPDQPAAAAGGAGANREEVWGATGRGALTAAGEGTGASAPWGRLTCRVGHEGDRGQQQQPPPLLPRGREAQLSPPLLLLPLPLPYCRPAACHGSQGGGSVSGEQQQQQQQQQGGPGCMEASPTPRGPQTHLLLLPPSPQHALAPGQPPLTGPLSTTPLIHLAATALPPDPPPPHSDHAAALPAHAAAGGRPAPHPHPATSAPAPGCSPPDAQPAVVEVQAAERLRSGRGSQGAGGHCGQGQQGPEVGPLPWTRTPRPVSPHGRVIPSPSTSAPPALDAALLRVQGVGHSSGPVAPGHAPGAVVGVAAAGPSAGAVVGVAAAGGSAAPAEAGETLAAASASAPEQYPPTEAPQPPLSPAGCSPPASLSPPSWGREEVRGAAQAAAALPHIAAAPPHQAITPLSASLSPAGGREGGRGIPHIAAALAAKAVTPQPLQGWPPPGGVPNTHGAASAAPLSPPCQPLSSPLAAEGGHTDTTSGCHAAAAAQALAAPGWKQEGSWGGAGAGAGRACRGIAHQLLPMPAQQVSLGQWWTGAGGPSSAQAAAGGHCLPIPCVVQQRPDLVQQQQQQQPNSCPHLPPAPQTFSAGTGLGFNSSAGGGQQGSGGSEGGGWAGGRSSSTKDLEGKGDAGHIGGEARCSTTGGSSSSSSSSSSTQQRPAAAAAAAAGASSSSSKPGGMQCWPGAGPSPLPPCWLQPPTPPPHTPGGPGRAAGEGCGEQGAGAASPLAVAGGLGMAEFCRPPPCSQPLLRDAAACWPYGPGCEMGAGQGHQRQAEQEQGQGQQGQEQGKQGQEQGQEQEQGQGQGQDQLQGRGQGWGPGGVGHPQASPPTAAAGVSVDPPPPYTTLPAPLPPSPSVAMLLPPHSPLRTPFQDHQSPQATPTVGGGGEEEEGEVSDDGLHAALHARKVSMRRMHSGPHGGGSPPGAMPFTTLPPSPGLSKEAPGRLHLHPCPAAPHLMRRGHQPGLLMTQLFQATSISSGGEPSSAVGTASPAGGLGSSRAGKRAGADNRDGGFRAGGELQALSRRGRAQSHSQCPGGPALLPRTSLGGHSSAADSEGDAPGLQGYASLYESTAAYDDGDDGDDGEGEEGEDHVTARPGMSPSPFAPAASHATISTLLHASRAGQEFTLAAQRVGGASPTSRIAAARFQPRNSPLNQSPG